VTLGSLVIASVRIGLIKRYNAQLRRRESAERARVHRSNRRTNAEGQRARERAASVSVQELLRRADSERTTKRPPRTGSSRITDRLGEDLYKG